MGERLRQQKQRPGNIVPGLAWFFGLAFIVPGHCFQGSYRI
jgi:hypothetical protein